MYFEELGKHLERGGDKEIGGIRIFCGQRKVNGSRDSLPRQRLNRVAALIANGKIELTN